MNKLVSMKEIRDDLVEHLHQKGFTDEEIVDGFKAIMEAFNKRINSATRTDNHQAVL